MFKKYIFFLLLILGSQLLAMEKRNKGKEKETEKSWKNKDEDSEEHTGLEHSTSLDACSSPVNLKPRKSYGRRHKLQADFNTKSSPLQHTQSFIDRNFTSSSSVIGETEDSYYLDQRSWSAEIPTSPRSIRSKLTRRKYTSLEFAKFGRKLEDLQLQSPRNAKYHERYCGTPLQSPRNRKYRECYLLYLLPDEILLLIIYQILKEIDLDVVDPTDPTDFLHLSEVYKSVESLALSCKHIRKLIPEGICTFYLLRLDQYQRPSKIQFTQESYTNKHFLSVPFFLTSILRGNSCEELLSKNLFLKKLISQKLISIDNHCLHFKLSSDDDDNSNLLTSILLEIQSPDDNFVTMDMIFKTILSSANNKAILKYLVNLNNIIDNNDYISTELMKQLFNGNCVAFETVFTEDSKQLYEESPHKFNAIIWAVIGGDNTLLNNIFEACSIEHLAFPNSSNQNLMHFGALYASPEILEYLLKKFSSLDDFESIINLIDDNKNSPLSLAVLSGFEEKTLILINHGAKLHSLIGQNFSPLDEKPPMLRELIQDTDILKKLSKKLNKKLKKYSYDQKLSREELINLCRKCKKRKETLLAKVCLMTVPIVTIIAYVLG